MAQLNSELYVNGVNLYQQYGYKSVSITTSAERVFGAQRSVTVESRSSGVLTSYQVNKSRPSFTVELVKINKDTLKTEPISANDLRDLSRLLFKNRICKLQERNIVYYGWFIKGQNWFNSANHGYLTLEFELAHPYCYSPIQTEHFWVSKSKRFALTNVATADELVFPRIRIIGVQNGDVKITNVTNNNVITVKSVKKDEDIIIEGETREIYSQTTPTENMFDRLEYTKDYLYLNYGENQVIVEGDCQIEFLYQCPMLIV